MIDYYSIEYGGKECLCVKLNDSTYYGTEITRDSPEEGHFIETLEDLGHFRGLKSLKISLRAPHITDLSCIGDLVGLRALDMALYSADTQVKDLDFLGRLTGLRELRIDGQFGKYGFNQYFRGITELSVLRSCLHLAYLTLAMGTGNLESYDYLGDLPELYYVSLSRTNVGKNIESLLPNACFIIINGDYVRYERGEGHGLD